MRIAHLADLHFCEEHFSEAKASIETVIAEHGRERFDLIALAGDTWDGPIQNSARAMFAAFLDLVKRLADCAPVAMIYGTPTHDTEGSLEVFETIAAANPIRILRPGVPCFVSADTGRFYSLDLGEPGNRPSELLLLLGVPEPSKKWLLAQGGATGKDASDEAVRVAMRELFLGLGGMRKEHPDLPCILLYHGQVSGARTGTGYAAGSGIAVSRDDLAIVGADYYALGDIHEPQQVGDLPAYYTGSIYPATWGETHKAGCNIVEIEDAGVLGPAPFASVITRLDFPHAQKVHVTIKFGEDYETRDDFAGRMVWLEITGTREELARYDPDIVLRKLLMLYGAIPGSRVTLNILPTETVRAGDIVEKHSLADKVNVWGENSSIEIPATALQKANDLERETEGAAGAGQGAHIRIDRLRLRGAIGIWKKSHKDEIDLDLEGEGAGVLALVGPNGHGKTTILENLHPWPRMLTRDGTLKDHFRLKDSCRDLYFADERTGWRYRALMQIRADIASGQVEYFLYRDQGAGFEPVPGIDGRKDAYEAAIAGLFGSLEMYLRTAFVTQRPTKLAPDLSAATKGERKALFAELAGIDYLQRYRETCKANGDALEGQIRTADALINAAADVDEVIIRLGQEIEDGNRRAFEADAAEEKSAAAGKGLAQQREDIAAGVQGIRTQLDRRNELAREIASLVASIDALEKEAQGFRVAAEGRAAAEAELERINALEAEARELCAAREKIDQANSKAIADHADKVRRNGASRREIQAELDAQRKIVSDAERDLARAEALLHEPIVDTCPTCGQQLPAETRERLTRARKSTKDQISQLLITAAKARGQAELSANAFAVIVDPPAPVPLSFDGAARLAELEADLAFTDEAAARETIRRADEARVRIESAESRIAEARARRAEALAQLDGISVDQADLYRLAARLVEADTLLTLERERYAQAKSAAAAARATVEAAERSKGEAEARKAKRDEARAARATQASELADWRLLERATGPDGIQALELDALAPSIAAVSNSLLAEAYGSRYQIQFRTTRLAGKGSGVKQVEDFEIVILDSESGDEQAIDTLSGGEAVWIRKALYDGFAVIRAKNTGTRFQTVFLDEADGALDPESRMLYLRMLEAAHRASGRYQTIIVTHSTELQAMVERTINVEDLGRAPNRKEAAA